MSEKCFNSVSSKSNAVLTLSCYVVLMCAEHLIYIYIYTYIYIYMTTKLHTYFNYSTNIRECAKNELFQTCLIAGECSFLSHIYIELHYSKIYWEKNDEV